MSMATRKKSFIRHHEKLQVVAIITHTHIMDGLSGENHPLIPCNVSCSLMAV